MTGSLCRRWYNMTWFNLIYNKSWTLRPLLVPKFTNILVPAWRKRWPVFYHCLRTEEGTTEIFCKVPHHLFLHTYNCCGVDYCSQWQKQENLNQNCFHMKWLKCCNKYRLFPNFKLYFSAIKIILNLVILAFLHMHLCFIVSIVQYETEQKLWVFSKTSFPSFLVVYH